MLRCALIFFCPPSARPRTSEHSRAVQTRSDATRSDRSEGSDRSDTTLDRQVYRVCLGLLDLDSVEGPVPVEKAS